MCGYIDLAVTLSAWVGRPAGQSGLTDETYCPISGRELFSLGKIKPDSRWSGVIARRLEARLARLACQLKLAGCNLNGNVVGEATSSLVDKE